MADDVPMARRTSTLHQIMNGTDKAPPPMAARAEMPPMPVPTAARPKGPGRTRLGLGRKLASICTTT